MKAYYVPQLDQSDCGFACLKMLIAHLYENENALYIKQNENHGPYSFQQLLEKGGEYGISLEGICVEEKKGIKNMNFPFIALLKKKNELYHYVLVSKYKNGLVYYLDPNEGEMCTSLKSFSSLWVGNSLIVNEFNKIDDLVFPEVRHNKDKTLLIAGIFQFIASLFLITGIFYIDDKSSVYIPLIFLGLSVIVEIILRVFLLKKMEKFDNNFLSGINVDKKHYYDFYTRYEEYKKQLFSSKMNASFSIIVILFLTGITLYNNVYNAFIVLMPLLLAIIDTKIVEVSIKEKDELIVLDEVELASIKNIDIFKSQLNKIHFMSYKMAKSMMLKKYIYIALLVLTALVTTAFNETFSLPYLIFYFAISYTLFEQYINFINYPLRKNALLKSRARLYNVMERI